MRRPRIQTTVREMLAATFWFGVALAMWRFALRSAFPAFAVMIGLAAGCLACATLVGRTSPVIQTIFWLVAVGVGVLPAVFVLVSVLLGALGLLPGAGVVHP